MIYPGSGNRSSRVNIIDTIKDAESKISNVSLVVSDVSSTLNEVVNDVAALETSTNSSISAINTALENCAKINTANTFSSINNFNAGFQALPLGTTTVTGQPAYGISVTPPSADKKSGGLQLWGIQFTQGDEWSNNALKVVHNELALFGNYQVPCSLTFDNANVVNFKVMPDDGSTANNGQGAIFDFQGWQWDNDSHTSKNSNCPVQILKNNAGELVDRSLLNKSEIDANYASKSSYDSFVSSTNSSISTINTTLGTTAKTNAANTFTAANTFNSTATIKGAATFNSTITKSTTSSDPSSLATTQVLNKAENNKLYPQLTADNTLTGYNTFEQKIEADGGLESDGSVVVKSGNVYVNKNSSITFLDDGEVTINNGASGYLYERGIPEILDNGRVYDLGVITQDTDLSGVIFNGDDTIIQTCEIWFTTADISYNITWPEGTIWIDYEDGNMPTLYPNMKYRISVRNEITDIVASISYTYPVR